MEASSDASGVNHTVSIPYDQPVKLLVSSDKLVMEKDDGTKLDTKGSTIIVQTHSCPKQAFLKNLTIDNKGHIPAFPLLTAGSSATPVLTGFLSCPRYAVQDNSHKC